MILVIENYFELSIEKTTEKTPITPMIAKPIGSIKISQPNINIIKMLPPIRS